MKDMLPRGDFVAGTNNAGAECYRLKADFSGKTRMEIVATKSCDINRGALQPGAA
jgi:hypothetical protein